MYADTSDLFFFDVHVRWYPTVVRNRSHYVYARTLNVQNQKYVVAILKIINKKQNTSRSPTDLIFLSVTIYISYDIANFSSYKNNTTKFPLETCMSNEIDLVPGKHCNCIP